MGVVVLLLGLLPGVALAGSDSEGRPFLDARRVAGAYGLSQPALAGPAAALRAQLGRLGVVSMDPQTGTASEVASLDGFLTGVSQSSPAAVALGYVGAHSRVFGLDRSALRELAPPHSYVSIDGATHLRWVQRYRGVPVFENELRASIDAKGRLINVLGSPLSDAVVSSTDPGLSASQALGVARADAGAQGAAPAITSASPTADLVTRFADGSQADLVIFHLSGGNRLAWHMYAYVDGSHTYEYVVDAMSGRVLFRKNIVDSFSGEGTAWFYNPSPIFGPASGLADGHTQALRLYPDSWGPISSTALEGNNAHVYSDVNNSTTPDSSEEIEPSGSLEGQPVFDYPWTDFSASPLAHNCSTDFPCTWASGGSSTSWETNRKQDAAQVFWFVNNFHDHLEEPPIGFTPAAGNFQFDNHGEGGVGGDPVDVGADSGADEFAVEHERTVAANNSFMRTEQDGVSPHMVLSLFLPEGSESYIDANSGDDASLVYHEYTHGLSHRLITDAQGFPRLDGAEPEAMGEAWSDWYAMDYLVSQDLVPDRAPGDVYVAYYLSHGNRQAFRTMAIDCPVGIVGAEGCINGQTGHQGGYTLADYGKVIGVPESHSDGEIWGQTLWQIRQALPAPSGTCAGPCSPKVEDLITRAMELGPVDPTILQERDAILQADSEDFAGADLATLWSVFAQRGMGYYASDRGSEDTTPVADFHTPPAATTNAPPATPTPTVETSPPPVSPPSLVVPLSVAPQIAGLRASRRTWRENAQNGSRANKHDVAVGTTFSFSLSESARVSFVFRRDLEGRSVGRRCVALSQGDRRARPCKRTISEGEIGLSATAGSNRLAFAGRISRSQLLRPGEYSVTVVAINAAGQGSRPLSLAFTVAG